MCKSAAKEVLFEWSHHRILSTDSKVRTALHVFIIDSGSEKFDLAFDPGEENSKLLTELDKESKEVTRLTIVESEVQQLKVELDEVQAKLKTTAIELGKTQARNKTMERHEQVRSLSQ